MNKKFFKFWISINTFTCPILILMVFLITHSVKTVLFSSLFYLLFQIVYYGILFLIVFIVDRFKNNET